jgi:cell wall-associated NlpC family hydrolase
MATRSQVIAEARSWIGTPWRHQGRTKGWSCDCVGVVIGVGVALGIFSEGFNVTGYSRAPDPTILRAHLEAHLDHVTGVMTGGDILLIAPSRRLPHHAAIYTFDGTMIHAIDKKRGVREHRLDDRMTIAAVYTYRGLED